MDAKRAPMKPTANECQKPTTSRHEGKRIGQNDVQKDHYYVNLLSDLLTFKQCNSNSDYLASGAATISSSTNQGSSTTGVFNNEQFAQCKICAAFMEKGQLKKHMTEHSEVMTRRKKLPKIAINENTDSKYDLTRKPTQSKKPILGRKGETVSRMSGEASNTNHGAVEIYKCTVCQIVGLWSVDLRNHHETRHSDIPRNRNIFEFVKFHQRFVLSDSREPNSSMTSRNRVIDGKNSRNDETKQQVRHHDGGVSMKKLRVEAHMNERHSRVGATHKHSAKVYQNTKRFVHEIKSSASADAEKAESYNRTGNKATNNQATSEEATKAPLVCQEMTPQEHIKRRPMKLHQNPKQPTVKFKMLQCKICSEKIREDKIEGHHYLKHRNIPFDMNNFKEYKTDNKRQVQYEVGGASMNKPQTEAHMNPQQMATRNRSTNVGQAKKTKNVPFTTPLQRKVLNFSRRSVINGQCSICRQQVDEKQFEQHFKQNHPQALKSMMANWLNGNQHTSFQDSHIDGKESHRNDSKIVSDTQKKSGKLESKFGERKSMPPNYATRVKPLNDNKKEEVAPENLPSFFLKEKVKNVELNVPPKLFKCVICQADGINEQNTVKHRTKKHSDRSEIVQMFELSTKGQDVECNVCGANMKKGRLDGHMCRVHSKILTNKLGMLNSQANEPLSIVHSSSTVTVKLYNCEICKADGIKEQNLIEHRLKKHKQIPIEINIFKLIGSTHRDQSDIYNKHVKTVQLNENIFPFHLLFRSEHRPSNQNPTEFEQKSICHYQVTTGELYKCGLCGANGLLNDQLKKHTKSHKSNVDVNYQENGTAQIVQCSCNCLILAHDFVNHMHKKHHNDKYTCVGQNGEVIGKKLIGSDLVKIFKCGACKCKSTQILEMDLEWHRIISHGNMSPDDVTFELMKRCNVCQKLLTEEKLDDHMKLRHSHLNAVKYGQKYKCGLCDVLCLEQSFKEHHAKYHYNFPFARNRSKISTVRQRFPCDTCGRRECEGRSQKHKLKTCLQYANNKNVLLHESEDEDFE